LSAQLLPEIRPEKEKKVDRLKLLAIQGRGRKTQMELARHYDIKDYPPRPAVVSSRTPIFQND